MITVHRHMALVYWHMQEVKGQNIGMVSLAIGACGGSKVIPLERALLAHDATFRATVQNCCCVCCII